jgi:hypothetical protein
MLVGRALKNSHMIRQRPDGSHAIYRIYLQIRVMIGRYSAVVTATNKRFDVPLVHVFTI